MYRQHAALLHTIVAEVVSIIVGLHGIIVLDAEPQREPESEPESDRDHDDKAFADVDRPRLLAPVSAAP